MLVPLPVVAQSVERERAWATRSSEATQPDGWMHDQHQRHSHKEGDRLEVTEQFIVELAVKMRVGRRTVGARQHRVSSGADFATSTPRACRPRPDDVDDHRLTEPSTNRA